MNTNTNKGVWMPTEILKIQNINLDEKVLLSIYRYYTVEGNTHCCCLTNDAICAMIGVNERKLQRMKSKLKSLGYITFNGGIKVWYRGDKSDTLGVTNLVVGGDKSDTLGVTNLTPKIKKEKRQNKDYNKKNTYTISEVTDEHSLEVMSDSLFIDRNGISKFEHMLQYHDDAFEVITYFNDNKLWDDCHIEIAKSHLEGNELTEFNNYVNNTKILHA